MNRDTDIRAAISDEASRIEEDALHSSKGHFNAGSTWSVVHYVLGLPAAVLAAIAGITAFSEDTALTASLAIVAAILGAMNAFLNPNDKATRHRSAGREFSTLKNSARRFREIRVPNLDSLASDQQLEVLAEKRDQLNDLSPDIPHFAYRKAVKDIDAGKATYRIDGAKS